MIQNILFDFGDVFINLKKQRCILEFEKIGISLEHPEIERQNDLFEKGMISENAFLKTFQNCNPFATLDEIKDAWNAILGDFPLYRLEFLQMLSQKYRLFLLTNTDKIHITHFEETVGATFYTDFYNCFEKVFYSYEMKMRKPNPAIFTTILSQYELAPKRTLFIDDKKENTDAATNLGILVWNLQVKKEDVVDLFTKILQL